MKNLLCCFLYVWLQQFAIAQISQSVGIGTNNPLGKLQVNHSSDISTPHLVLFDSLDGLGSAISFRKQGTVKGLRMGGVPGPTRSDMSFYIDSLLWFKNNRLGVFTNTPQHEIDLNGDVNIGNQLFLNGSAGQAGQVLRSRGPQQPPKWMDDSLLWFKANSNNFPVASNTLTAAISSVEEEDGNNMHNNANGILIAAKTGIYQFVVRCAFTKETVELAMIEKVVIEIRNADDSPFKTVEQATPIPQGFQTFTSHTQLVTQLKLLAGQKVRLFVYHTHLGSIMCKVEEYSVKCESQ